MRNFRWMQCCMIWLHETFSLVQGLTRNWLVCVGRVLGTRGDCLRLCRRGHAGRICPRDRGRGTRSRARRSASPRPTGRPHAARWSRTGCGATTATVTHAQQPDTSDLPAVSCAFTLPGLQKDASTGPLVGQSKLDPAQKNGGFISCHPIPLFTVQLASPCSCVKRTPEVPPSFAAAKPSCWATGEWCLGSTEQCRGYMHLGATTTVFPDAVVWSGGKCDVRCLHKAEETGIGMAPHMSFVGVCESDFTDYPECQGALNYMFANWENTHYAFFNLEGTRCSLQSYLNVVEGKCPQCPCSMPALFVLRVASIGFC